MLLALGLVAALALPKMAEQQSRARTAKLRASAQSLQVLLSAVRLGASAQRSDCRDTTPQTLLLDGEPVPLVHCQPQALADFGHGLLAAARLSPADGWQLAPQAAASAPTAGAVLAIELADAPQPASCAITYTAATAEQPAQLTLQTAGC